ncbi:MAG: hypothetical protein QF357_07130 [Dehalococcoidia bacterium]|jgi:hypothetical protein|nr:hypothetical protein [Dehalococcoidia bacterium]
MNLWNRGDRDPDGRRSVTRRQLLVRFLFYVVVFAVIIWWANS